MRSQSKWLMIVMLIFAFGAAGCGKKKQDPGAESLDMVPDADTATVDDNGAAPEASAADSKAADALPMVDNSKPFDDSPKAKAPEVKGSGDTANYTVQKGDTLMKIAFNIYGDIAQWKNLYNWNKDSLKHASQLEKGMQLKYEKPDSDPSVERNGDPYLIKKGDTLATIADDLYAKPSKWKKLWANNKTLIKNPNRIYAGFYLYYQITEQERKMAETIKAKRGSSAAEPAAAPAAAPVAPAAPTPAKTGAALKGLTGGGLSALTGGAAARVPASATAH